MSKDMTDKSWRHNFDEMIIEENITDEYKSLIKS